MLDKNIKVLEQDDQLKLEYKWFAPVAIFALICCIIWNVSVIFNIDWYGIIGGAYENAHFIFFLIPLTLLAVGLGLSYYTLSLFLNTTTISVNDGKLSVKHGPLPWFGNLSIDRDKVEQLFVKRVIKRRKNGRSESFILTAKIIDGKNIKLLPAMAMLTPELAREIEARLESFMGIRDVAVEGEFESELKQKVSELSRQQTEKLNPIDIELADLKEGFIFDYNDDFWEVAHVLQYDWKHGETDRFFELVNDKGDSLLLYLRQDMAIFIPWIEVELSQFEIQKEQLQQEENGIPKSSFSFKGLDYQYSKSFKGRAYTNGNREEIKVREWLYFTFDQKNRLRLVYKNGNYQVFVGEKKSPVAFDNFLPV